jgi:predicted O-methyltransferase YrrM
MKYLHGIPYVNRTDLLALAVGSVRALWEHAVIVDNSEDGLDPREWSIPVLRPHVPLTFSQSMNLLLREAARRDCDTLLFMHNDAEAAEGTPEKLLATLREARESRRRWGAVFTHYDTLAAFDLEAARAIGGWDTTLPHYFADNDYYRRLRLYGYEIVDTGLAVTHHNDASSTVKSEPTRGFLNGVTFPLYASYYAAKWGGEPGGEKFDWAFDGAEALGFVEHLRRQDLFRQLAESYETVEGNCLERADPRTTAAQIEAIRLALRLTRPRCVLETGTNKSLFGYVLSQLARDVTLYTFDGDARVVGGGELLNAAQSKVRSVFTLGDTKQTLRDFDAQAIDLAWIDGGHDEATALSDLRQAARLRVPLVAVDDARTMPEVARAIEQVVGESSDYERLANPYYAHDARGIVLLRRRADRA